MPMANHCISANVEPGKLSLLNWTQPGQGKFTISLFLVFLRMFHVCHKQMMCEKHVIIMIHSGTRDQLLMFTDTS